MVRLVGTGIGMLVGGALAWVSIYGLVQSQTAVPDTSPANSDRVEIEYGTNG